MKPHVEATETGYRLRNHHVTVREPKGHMWMEEKAGIRINETRVKQAERTGAEILATVCPLCMISLDSAVKVLNLDERIRVLDILELVEERVKP